MSQIIQSIKESVQTCFSKYIDFNGRAQRSEFWYFQLFILGTSIILAIIGSAMPALAILSSLFTIAIILPSLAVGARRLHDTGRSGWWQLVCLIPLIGLCVLIYFFAQPSQK